MARRGFTLIELLIVISLLAGFTALLLPSLGLTGPTSRRSAVAGKLAALRETAVGTKTEQLLTVDFNERKLVFGTGKDAVTLAMGDGETWELYVPSRGTISNGTVSVALPPLASEECLILYVTEAGATSSIILDNLSGDIAVEEGRREPGS